MASHSQLLYGNLASKVAEKTAELEEKHERLELALRGDRAGCTSHVEELARSFRKHHGHCQGRRRRPSPADHARRGVASPPGP